jgi:hypothetical protein
MTLAGALTRMLGDPTEELKQPDPLERDNRRAIIALKRRGLTRAAIAAQLGLPLEDVEKVIGPAAGGASRSGRRSGEARFDRASPLADGRSGRASSRAHPRSSAPVQ